jgi:thioredoxin reductase
MASQRPSKSRRALPSVCVIGAGSSGIAAVKALRDHGIPFDCFEKSDRVGGLWVFQSKTGLSAAYRSLHINTSRLRTQYADYPMPAHYPHFPHHSLMTAYFDAYVDHFGLREHITFETSVERAHRLPDGTWRVELARAGGATEVRHYDALAVANGHHWDPRWPEPAFPGEFHGHVLHSHDYVDPCEPHDLRGKRVVVVGMGNSAMDIACELGRRGVAQAVFLAARRGAYTIPHYILGRPLDQILTLPPWVPIGLRLRLGGLLLRLAVGKMTDYGLPRPDHRLGQAHPTISSEILPRLAFGDITPKPGIKALRGDRVEFADGSIEDVDAIVYCTGYKVSFPFFDPGFLAAPDNELPLFFRVFRPGIPDLFFIGLLQPLGAIMPLAEAQSSWMAEYLVGEYALPSLDRMHRIMERHRRAMARRYVASSRHTMQVDFDDYLAGVARERARGRKRAARRGMTLPVGARAGQRAPSGEIRENL